MYEPCGYQVLFTSAKREQGIQKLREVLQNKTTAVAGPSSVANLHLLICCVLNRMRQVKSARSWEEAAIPPDIPSLLN